MIDDDKSFKNETLVKIQNDLYLVLDFDNKQFSIANDETLGSYINLSKIDDEGVASFVENGCGFFKNLLVGRKQDKGMLVSKINKLADALAITVIMLAEDTIAEQQSNTTPTTNNEGEQKSWIFN